MYRLDQLWMLFGLLSCFSCINLPKKRFFLEQMASDLLGPPCEDGKGAQKGGFKGGGRVVVHPIKGVTKGLKRQG